MERVEFIPCKTYIYYYCCCYCYYTVRCIKLF